MSVTADIVMALIEGYAENRQRCGGPEYNQTTALSRKLVRAAIETLVEAAAPKAGLLAGIPATSSVTQKAVAEKEVAEQQRVKEEVARKFRENLGRATGGLEAGGLGSLNNVAGA